ncbi:MAG: SPOR domain-containing protein [Bacteroidales bacterium]
MNKRILFVFLLITFKSFSQSPIFKSLYNSQLGWGKFSLISNTLSDNIISKHININQKAKGMPGFRIQVFFASGTDAKNQALKIKTEIRNLYPQYEAYIIYEEPFFKLRIGDFRTKIEAYKLFKIIQENYPSAFIVDDLISFPNLY